MNQRLESIPTFRRIYHLIVNLFKRILKIRAGWELLLWAAVYSQARRVFGWQFDLLAGYGLKPPPELKLCEFITNHDRSIGMTLMSLAVIVAFFEFTDILSHKLKIFFRVPALLALLLLAWLLLTMPIIDTIQQIQ